MFTFLYPHFPKIAGLLKQVYMSFCYHQALQSRFPRATEPQIFTKIKFKNTKVYQNLKW